jgi:Phage protein Gp138 N-terminal domain
VSHGPAPTFVDIPARLQQLEDAFDSEAWQLLCGLRVACPGIIQSFNATKQTVTVQLAIRENILQDLVKTPIAVNPLVDVPILVPRAGGYSLTLPISVGDECLVIFGDNCIDGWWQSGGIQNQLDRRRHDLSDGFALLGCWSQPRVIPSYSASKAQLRSDDGATYVEVDKTGAVTVHAATVSVDATNVDIDAAAQVDITAATLVNINGSGHTTIEGKDFLTHQHTGVQTGGNNSGPVF